MLCAKAYAHANECSLLSTPLHSLYMNFLAQFNHPLIVNSFTLLPGPNSTHKNATNPNPTATSAPNPTLTLPEAPDGFELVIGELVAVEDGPLLTPVPEARATPDDGAATPYDGAATPDGDATPETTVDRLVALVPLLCALLSLVP